MDYCTLGRSGLRVSRLNLGAMTFGAGTGIWQSSAGRLAGRRLRPHRPRHGRGAAK